MATAVVVTLLVLLAVGIVLNQLLRLRKWLKRPPSREVPGPPDVRPRVALLRRRQPKLLPRPRLSSRPATFMGIWVEGRTEEANADQAKSDLKGAGENSKDAVNK